MVSITLTTEQMRAVHENIANNTPVSITLTTDQVNGLISDSLPTTPAFTASLGAAIAQRIDVNTIADHSTPAIFTHGDTNPSAPPGNITLSPSMLQATASRVVR